MFTAKIIATGGPVRVSLARNSWIAIVPPGAKTPKTRFKSARLALHAFAVQNVPQRRQVKSAAAIRGVHVAFDERESIRDLKSLCDALGHGNHARPIERGHMHLL